MSSQWSGQSQGSSLGYKMFIFVIKHFGLKTSYFFLAIVAYIFLIVANKERKHLFNFYYKTLNIKGRKARKLVRRNFFLLGSTLIDKYAFFMGKAKTLKLKSHDSNLIKPFINDPDSGLLLISAHLGNWDIAGRLLKTYGEQKVNIVLVNNEKQSLQDLKSLYDQDKLNIIPMQSDLSHIFLINAAINRGEVVCMHADRFMEKAKTLDLNFFGRDCRFPRGPFEIAVKLKVPTAYSFNVKTTNYRYEFFSTPPQVFDNVQNAAQAFADELEVKTKTFPEQWFNYYNYFAENESNKGTG